MDARLNQLAKVDDFERALIIAQYAHEKDFRAFTGPELYQFIKAQLDLTGLSNTAGLPEEFPEPNTTLEATNAQEWTVLGPGLYNKIGAGTIELADDEFAFAQFDGSDFNRVLRVKVPKQDLTPIENNISGLKGSIGVEQLSAGNNFLKILSQSTIDDEDIWEDGYYDNMGLKQGSTTFKRTKGFYPLLGGIGFNFNVAIYLAACVCFYDENKNFISSLQRPSSDGSPNNFWNTNYTTPNITAFVRLSHRKTIPTANVAAVNNLPVNNPTSQVYLKTNEADDKVQSVLDNYGFEVIPAGDNALQDLNDTALEENEFWGKGYLNSRGEPDSQERFWHSKKFYEVIGGGVYEFRLYMILTHRMVIYDENYNIISTVSGSGPTGTWTGEMTMPKAAKYIRISHDQNETYLPLIFFRLKKSIYKNPIGDADFTSVYQRQYPSGQRFPIITFISDDCYKQNDWFINVLNNQNVKATFAVIAGKVGDADCMTEEQLIDLKNKRHELANHTVTHQRTGDLSPSDQFYEISKANAYLLTLCDKVPTCVPPFGSRSVDTDKIIRQFHKTSIRTNYFYDYTNPVEDSINVPPIDKYLLKRFSFDAGVQNVSIIDRLREAVDACKVNGGWLIFAIHPQYNEYRLDLPGGAMRRQELSDLIGYIKTQNIDILTCEKAIQIYDNVVSVGNQRLDPEFWEKGMDGVELGKI